MNEEDFWLFLAARLTGELGGAPENEIRFLWCDCLTPEEYNAGDHGLEIVGRAEIYGGKEWRWRFTLVLPDEVGSPDDIDWEQLLVRAGGSGWTRVDLSASRVRMSITSSSAGHE